MNRKTLVMAAMMGFILVALVIAIGCSSGLDPAKTIVQSARADSPAAHVRWDIVNVLPGSPPGGSASALAENGTRITITGSGTFVAPAGRNETSSATTGGGTWTVVTSGGITLASGTYSVTGLVHWEEKGTFPLIPGGVGGLAILRVEFSDGTRGVLTVSCHAPSGSVPAVFEGITMAKEFLDFWNHGVAVAGVEGNRTLFQLE